MGNQVYIIQTVYAELGDLLSLLTYNEGVVDETEWETKQYNLDGMYQSGVIEVDPYTTRHLVQQVVYSEVLSFLDEIDLQVCNTKDQITQQVVQDLEGQTGEDIQPKYLVMSQLTYDEVGNIGAKIGNIGALLIKDELLGYGYIYLVEGGTIYYDVDPRVQLRVRGSLVTLTVKQRIKYCGGLQRAYYLEGIK